MGEETEFVLSYETIFELARLEKNRPELQKLDGNFFKRMADYLKNETNILKELQNKYDISSFAEREKNDKQLGNLKRILKELSERRQKKIISMAFDKSITSSIIDVSAMTEEERDFFSIIFNIFDKYKNNVINNILDAKHSVKIENKNGLREEMPAETPPQKNNSKTVRFLRDVPQFIGPELEEYGPFEENEITSLPIEIAGVLLTKGTIEIIGE